MLILLSTVFSLYLCQSQTQYQIHTTIQYHKLVILQIIYQRLFMKTKIFSDKML